MALTLSFDQALAVLRGAVVPAVRDDPFDLTQRQLAVILSVYLSPTPLTLRALAAELAIGKPAVTRALDRLEALGLVRRMADLRDRRSLIVGRTVPGTLYLRELADRVARAAAVMGT